jgi:hypothetical protein
MERKRVQGRFVKEGAVAEEETKESRVATPRPKYCRTFARKRLAEALPEIMAKFAEEAKKGSIQHMKILTKLGGLDQGEMPAPRKRRPKSIMAKLLEDLRKPAGSELQGERPKGAARDGEGSK